MGVETVQAPSVLPWTPVFPYLQVTGPAGPPDRKSGGHVSGLSLQLCILNVAQSYAGVPAMPPQLFWEGLLKEASKVGNMRSTSQ